MSIDKPNVILPSGKILVESVTHLIALLGIAEQAHGSPVADFVMQLNSFGGSSKRVSLDETSPPEFWVFNYLDDSEETLSGAAWENSMIFDAISKNAFYCDDTAVLDFVRRQSVGARVTV